MKTLCNKYAKNFLLLPIRQRLLTGFLVKWIVLSVVGLLTKRFLLFEEWTWSHVLFYGGMMALFLTVPFNRKEIKAIFRKKNKTIPLKVKNDSLCGR